MTKLREYIFEVNDRVGDINDIEVFGVNNQTGIEVSWRKVSEDLSPYKIIRKNCFAYNPYRVNIWSIWLFTWELWAVSPAYIVFKVDENKIIPELLLQFLKSSEWLFQINKNTHGWVRKALSFKELWNIDVNFWLIENQKILFAKWQNMQKEFNWYDKIVFDSLNYIKSLRESILSDAIQGKLVPQDPTDEPASVLLQKIQAEKEQLIADKKIKKPKPLAPIRDDEKPFELPKGWEWVRLGEITRIISWYSFNSNDFWINNWVKCIKITNAWVGKIIETNDTLPIEYLKKYNQFLVKEWDLILALTRPYIADGLKVSLCDSWYNNSLLNQRVCLIRAFLNLNKIYLFILLRSEYILNIYKSRFEKMNLQPNLKINDVSELLIPLPPLTEQHCIVAKVDELMTLCDQLEARVTDAQQQGKLLMESVLSEVMG